MHTQLVQIAKTLIFKKVIYTTYIKEASNCKDLFHSILQVGCTPAKVWKSSMFSGAQVSGMVPILKFPFNSKRQCLDMLLLLFDKAPEVAKVSLLDCMSDLIDDLEMATWELVLDSTIIRMRTNNLFYRLSLSYGNKITQDKTGQTSRDELSSYVVFFLLITVVGAFENIQSYSYKFGYKII